MRILRRTRLTTDFDLPWGEVGPSARTARHCPSHTSDDVLPVLPRDARRLMVAIHGIQRHSLDRMDGVRTDVVASVGDEGCEVSYL